MPTSIRLTLRQLHNQHMDSFGTCPEGPECPFCIADRQAGEREHGDYSSDTPGTDEEKRNFRIYNRSKP